MPILNKLKKTLWVFQNRRRLTDILRDEYNKELEEKKPASEEPVKEEPAEDPRTGVIRNSSYFDPNFYVRNNIEFQNTDTDLAEHYLLYGGFLGKDPSASFSSEEYLTLHTDVAMEHLNPLLHYEQHGRRENRPVSTLQVKEPVFPEGTKECERCYEIHDAVTHRTAILAMCSTDGTIHEDLLYLLKGIREVSDNVLLVGDCPIYEEELEKLEGLVSYACFRRHHQYDFGSYKRGLDYFRSTNLPETTEELILLNDSIYGPVYPFAESFDVMAKREAGFWGYVSLLSTGIPYLSSCFLVFRKAVLDSRVLDGFFERVKGTFDRSSVVTKLETKLTPYLRACGFSFASYVPEEDHVNIFDQPLTLLRDYRLPVLKKKALSRKPVEDPEEVLSLIGKENPELRPLITYAPYEELVFSFPSFDAHQSSFAEKTEKLKKKYERGEKLKALFLITNPSMFPSLPLYERMRESEDFEPYVAMIPDLRWPGKEEEDLRKGNEELLRMGFEEERLLHAEKDDLGRWNDLCSEMDIVCYNTPYQLSSFRYLPRYSVGRDFLPVSVNYGFYRSRYDDKILALDSYRYMWKAFFECEDTLDQYKTNTMGDGANGVITGYVKMDRLNEVTPTASDRRRILVALHHSVEGGANDILSLGNFVRYSDYFLQLPDRYPEIDFVYRPHPYLFRSLRREDLWGEEKVEAYLAALKAKKNVFFDDSGDYFPSFVNSDACIQDCGSYLVEYLYTGKPCCYMLKSESDIGRKFSRLGQDCLEQCEIAYDTDAIDAFIRETVLKGNDGKKASRLEFMRRIMVHYPHAADAALDEIRRGILKEEEK